MDAITTQVLNRFSALCAIPRPSGGEAAVTTYLTKLLTEAGYAPETDSANNLRCALPGTAGCTDAPGVVLQAHTDMVCVAAPGSDYRPGQDAVRTVNDGLYLRSDGRSTLGADNGMGAALMLWLALDSQTPHPPLLLLFTSGEEQGLTGARALDPAWLEGYAYYINLDAFRSDAVIVASAGGLRQSWSRPLTTQPVEGEQAFTLTLSGLTGGHSGFDIQLPRRNALTTLGEFLTACPGGIAELRGGTGFNAIPTEASAVLSTAKPEAVIGAVEQWRQELAAFRASDPGLTVTLEEHSPVDTVWDHDTRRQVLNFLARLPSGVQSWRLDSPDTPACSGNPAMVACRDGIIVIRHMGRGASRAEMAILRGETDAAARSGGFTCIDSSSYAPWEGKIESLIAQRIRDIRRRQDGSAMAPVAVHVGLESSILLEKAPHLAAVSLGCDILDAHSVHERVRLNSIPRLAELLQALLEELGQEEEVQA